MFDSRTSSSNSRQATRSKAQSKVVGCTYCTSSSFRGSECLCDAPSASQSSRCGAPKRGTRATATGAGQGQGQGQGRSRGGLLPTDDRPNLHGLHRQTLTFAPTLTPRLSLEKPAKRLTLPLYLSSRSQPPRCGRKKTVACWAGWACLAWSRL